MENSIFQFYVGDLAKTFQTSFEEVLRKWKERTTKKELKLSFTRKRMIKAKEKYDFSDQLLPGINYWIILTSKILAPGKFSSIWENVLTWG